MVEKVSNKYEVGLVGVFVECADGYVLVQGGTVTCWFVHMVM